MYGYNAGYGGGAGEGSAPKWTAADLHFGKGYKLPYTHGPKSSGMSIGQQYGIGNQGATGGGTPGSGGGQPPANVNPAPEGHMNTLGEFGGGLIDPESDLSKRWMEQLREQVGKSSDAAQRAAAYRAAQAGMGSGASPELMQMETDIGVAGEEAMGNAASDFMLKAPTLGVNALSSAMGGGVSMRGQDLQSRIAENRNILERELANANIGMQQRGLDQERYLRELAYLYGGGF